MELYSPMMQVFVQDGKILHEGAEVGRISYQGIYPSIFITGIVNVQVKREGGEYRIIEDGLPAGKFRKMGIDYMGRPYQLEKGGFSRLMSFRDGTVNVLSLGMQVGKIGWINGSIVVDCERSDLVPLLVFASFFSFYARRGRRRLPSPYREIYYGLLALFFAYIALLSFFPYNFLLDVIIPIVIMAVEYLVVYMARRK